MTDADKATGLYSKYMVERINDPDGKHNDCDFFVLDLTHDPIARFAMNFYIQKCIDDGYSKLAADLTFLMMKNDETVKTDD
jgi:hypothetical protein